MEIIDQREARRRHRAVRRPDAAEARARSWRRPVRRSSARARIPSTSPRTASASSSCCKQLGLRQPANATARDEERAVELAREVGFPLVVRPSYVLGGRAMEVVYEEDDLRQYMKRCRAGLERQPGAARPLPGPRHRGRRGCGLRRRRRADRRHHGAHRAGGRAFRRFQLLAAAGQPFARKCRTNCAPRRASWRTALNVVGLMNMQFAIQNGIVYVLEVNPRASRTVPFVSKATGVPLAKIAARVMVGRKLAELGALDERVPPYYSVKEAVFPFSKFPEADPILGPGDEVDRRGDGHRPHLRRGLRQGAGGERRRAADAAASACCRCATATRTAPSRSRAGSDERGFEIVATQRHGSRRWRRPAFACRSAPQGARGPAAHRRHDQERRDRPDRQYDRGQAAIRESRSIRREAVHPQGDLLHDGRGGARRPARRSTTSRTSTSTGCRTCTGSWCRVRAPITLRGAEKLRAELRKLKARGPARASSARSPRRARMATCPRTPNTTPRASSRASSRAASSEIEKRLANAQVIDPAALPGAARSCSAPPSSSRRSTAEPRSVTRSSATTRPTSATGSSRSTRRLRGR